MYLHSVHGRRPSRKPQRVERKKRLCASTKTGRRSISRCTRVNLSLHRPRFAFAQNQHICSGRRTSFITPFQFILPSALSPLSPSSSGPVNGSARQPRSAEKALAIRNAFYRLGCVDRVAAEVSRSPDGISRMSIIFSFGAALVHRARPPSALFLLSTNKRIDNDLNIFFPLSLPLPLSRLHLSVFRFFRSFVLLALPPFNFTRSSCRPRLSIAHSALRCGFALASLDRIIRLKEADGIFFSRNEAYYYTCFTSPITIDVQTTGSTSPYKLKPFDVSCFNTQQIKTRFAKANLLTPQAVFLTLSPSSPPPSPLRLLFG